MNSLTQWLNSPDIRPYIYLRRENKFANPGRHLPCDWFRQEPIYKDPLKMNEVAFANQILTLEARAFQQSAMPMPRWVFYDCAVMPGFVCGFARRTSTFNVRERHILEVNMDLEWTPISLFIIIPTLRSGEWVAHNLCTANSLVDEEDKIYALGFLTKAFGLWYANVEVLCGMTQWNSPARRLHSHYGPFEVLTAYTPVHSYAQTLTYRSRLDYRYWPSFFEPDKKVSAVQYKSAGFVVDPTSEDSLKLLQQKIENDEGPFYLSSSEIRLKELDAELTVYRI
jgi:hypothetical protein